MHRLTWVHVSEEEATFSLEALLPDESVRVAMDADNSVQPRMGLVDQIVFVLKSPEPVRPFITLKMPSLEGSVYRTSDAIAWTDGPAHGTCWFSALAQGEVAP